MVQATYIVQGMLSVPQAFTNVGWAKSKTNAAKITYLHVPGMELSWGPQSSSR